MSEGTTARLGDEKFVSLRTFKRNGIVRDVDQLVTWTPGLYGPGGGSKKWALISLMNMQVDPVVLQPNTDMRQSSGSADVVMVVPPE